MVRVEVHRCDCEACRGRGHTAIKRSHRQLNLVLAYADERQRRWVAALESLRVGRGGIEAVAQITGLDPKTIRRGQRELSGREPLPARSRIRRVGAGRPTAEKKIRGC
jgi:hypothetical protein